MRISAFRALRPPPDIASLVACVPYDTVDTAEAMKLAAGNPRSFLRVVRPEIDLPDGTDIHSDAVYEKAAENFRAFQENGTLVAEQEPCLYVYRQKMGDHIQRGVFACCHVDDYADNVIRKHEKTRADKENDRTRLIRTVRAHTGPVFLTYRDNTAIDSMIARIEEGAPLYDFTAVDGIGHTIWRVEGGDDIVAAFGGIEVCYIADGHHRAAGAARAAAAERQANAGEGGEYDWFPAVLFPAGQLKILPYNRCVADLNGMTVDVFLEAVGRVCSVSGGASHSPTGPRSACMYTGGKWYKLGWAELQGTGPVESLDVSFL